MRDLNALKTFYDVAKAQGYSAAYRQTGQARATLSRHVSTLEDELGTRLIERSSQSFRLTDPGLLLFERCKDIFGQLDEAVALVEDRQREPQGLVRMSVPSAILELYIGEAVQRYLEATPLVRVQIEVTNRAVDIRHESIDFAVRGRSGNSNDPLDLVRVPLAQINRVFVVHPRWQHAVQPTLEATLQSVPTLAWTGANGESRWQLLDATGQSTEIPITPRLIVGNMYTLRNAVLAGMGMAIIPLVHVAEDIRAGRLLAPKFELTLPIGVIHAVHLGHRGMRPAVRHLLDWLKEASEPFRDPVDVPT